MGCRRAFRRIALMLLLGFCVVLLLEPVSALAMSGMGRPSFGGSGSFGEPGDLEEEKPEKEDIEIRYANPLTFRGLGYGVEWNYALTFHYATRPLWLYGNNRKTVFRQKLESGTETTDIRLTLWVRYAYDELAICMEPALLDVLARAGVTEILLQNGNLGEPPTKEVLYRVEDLQQLMARAGEESDNVLQLWVGESTGPRLILKNWSRIQMSPKDDPGRVL